MPIWSGEIQGFGDPLYGTCGWDYRTWETVEYTNSGENDEPEPVIVEKYAYDYADLNDLFEN